MTSKKRANSVVSVATDDAGNITWTVEGAGAVMLHRSKLSAAFLGLATTHGLIQRGSDRAALSRDEKTGQPASPADRLARIRSWVEHAESGTDSWRMNSERGPSRSADEMLAALTPDEMRAKLAALGYDVSNLSKPAVDVTPEA